MIMLRLIFIITLWLPSSPVQATDRYVDNGTSGCSTPTDIDYNPATRACGSGSELVYSTWAAALAVEGANDTIYGRAGLYVESISNTITSGSGPDFSTTTSLIGWPGETVELKPSTQGSGACVIFIGPGKEFITLQNLVLDASNCTAGAVANISGGPVRPNFIKMNQVTFRNNPSSQGLLIAADNSLLTNSISHNNGKKSPATGGRLHHGVYWSQGSGNVISHSQFYNNTGWGIHLYPSILGTRVEYNLVYDNQTAPDCPCGEIVVPGDTDIVRWNVVQAATTASATISVAWGSATKRNTTIEHNTIYRGSNGVWLQSGTGHKVRNNIILGANVAINDNATGTTTTTNLTAGTPGDVWTDHTNLDFSLKAGSAAINAGTSIGLAACGLPDQGAFETPVITAASINGNLMDVTICNVNPPIIPGTFTVGCTGTGCGTPTVVSTALLGGSGGIVRLETSVTCDVSQTWTVSSSSGTTDSALVGNQYNQPLHTTTNFPVDSSACDGGGGPPPPASEEALYEFDGDCNDSSGNLNHATCNGTTFVTGKYGQALQTNQGEDDYADTGVLNTVDPSSTHVVISAGIYIDPADLGDTADVWGTVLGTDQKLVVYRTNANVWQMIIQGTTGAETEFPVVAGWTHVCLKMNATTDVATLYIDGVAGTVSGASTIPYTSYGFASDLRFGLPPSFSTSLSGNHKFDKAYVYTSDVSCTELSDAFEPSTSSATAVQAAHQWQGVYLDVGSVPEDRGAVNEQRTIVKGGAATLVVQLSCTGGDCGSLQPRFRYNIDGGAFNNVVPDFPTADRISYWISPNDSSLNSGAAEGPLTGALTHTDGITLLTTSAVPTITMSNNSSYTLRGSFRVNANAGTVVCFKVYDQGGSALASYTPTEGACLTVIDTQAIGGF